MVVVVIGHGLLVTAIWPNLFPAIRSKIFRMSAAEAHAAADVATPKVAPSKTAEISSHEVAA